jgi:hypothetical protein
VTDADEYQAGTPTDLVEEAGQYPTSTPIDRLSGAALGVAFRYN